MIDYLLRYDAEYDGKYKKEMMEMLNNKDKKERNVLKTYITKDIGNVFYFYWMCCSILFLSLQTLRRGSWITTSAGTNHISTFHYPHSLSFEQ